MGLLDDNDMLNEVLRHSSDLICFIDAAGHFRHVSAASQRVLGYDSSTMVGKHFAHILHPDDAPGTMVKCLNGFEQAEAGGFESRCLNQAGEEVIVEWSTCRPPTDVLLLCIGRDVTAQRRETQRVRAQEALHRTVAAHGFDMMALLNEEGYYTYVGGATLKSLGYQPEELVGHSPFEFIHPEDVAAARASLADTGSQSSYLVPDCRFRAANGEWRWIETSVSNQLQNPAIRAYTVSFRDVTERKHSSSELAESAQRFRLLFENNPALAVFQDIDGLVLDINPAFLVFLHKSKYEVIGQHLHDFLPADVRDLFEEKFKEAIGGHKVHFEVTVQGQAGEQHLKVNKIPLVVEGKIIGVHVAAEDITEMAAAQRLIKQQAAAVTTTLESITDAFLSLDSDWNLTFINREAERLINTSRERGLGKSIWEFFPEEGNSTYRRHYEQALETGNTVQFEAFFARENRWLELKAYPAAKGLSIYFSDITQRVEADKQLKLLALVAQGTDNGVLITDAAGHVEWVNAAFTRHTGYTLAEMLGQKPGEMLQGPETDPAVVQRIRERMKRRKPFSVTILNYKKSGQKLWFTMDITPIYNEADELTQFVALLQNINYRKEVEASQAKMTQELYRHNRDLQQFAYVISHNLRGPLANALGLAKMLTKVDKNSEVFTVALAHLRESMGQADTVLKDLNLVLSIRDRQDVLEQEMVSLADVCAQAVSHLDEALQQCEGRVNLDVAEGLAMRGNRAYLYSIFYNLLSNSIKYRADERPLLVEISCVYGEHGGPTISFTDNGSGFDTFKAGSDVFQLYKRFHTNQRGRGIGLFLVKTHVEALGGKIEVTSNINSGTRFLIHLDQH
jgi:PAS domain S-box-containing protein